jgi:hypothetical protein
MKTTNTYYHLIPFAVLYFFFNSFLLPEGLLYSALLTPVMIYYLYREGDLGRMVLWGVLFLIPIPFHLLQGADVRFYLISIVLVFTVFVFFFAARQLILQANENMERVFRTILFINGVLIAIALLSLPVSALRELFWYEIPISAGVESFPRLKLLAYEPSHYALLLSPVFIFYILKVFTGQTLHPLILLAAVAIPLLLSLSFGVIAAILLALLIGSLAYVKKLPAIYWSYVFYSAAFIIVTFLLIWFIWPENPVYERISNIFSGQDTSARGRLFNSFWFAADLIKENNVLLGTGPGQVKILAHDMIVNYYKYTGNYAEIVRIPNAMGEMLAVYGVIGFTFKLILEIYFFLRLKVYNNYYTLVLFTFIFIYQFTGSFLTNVAEIGIWAIVYSINLPRFDVNNLEGGTK